MNKNIPPKQRMGAAILAGGKSARMKTNKAVLELCGRRLIEYVVDAVKTVIEKPMIISNTPEPYSFLGLPIFPDIIKSIGPLGGIYTALNHCESVHCLVLACDLPFITPELLGFLLEQERNYDVLAIDSGQGVEPLCAIYRQSCLTEIERQIDSGQYKVSDFYSNVDINILRIGSDDKLYNSNLFFNVNDPADYREAQRVNRNKKVT